MLVYQETAELVWPNKSLGLLMFFFSFYVMVFLKDAMFHSGFDFSFLMFIVMSLDYLFWLHAAVRSGALWESI